MMKTPRFSRKILFILVLLFLITTTVYANAGTGFLLPGLFHVLIGNFIIGLIEAFFIRKVFKISVNYGMIVLGNYVSSLLGYVALVVGFSDINFMPSDLPKTLILLFIASVLIEWPFFVWAVKERTLGFSKTSFKYTFYAQLLSYALLVPFYFTSYDEGRLPPGVFMSDDFTFLSRNAYSYRMRPQSDSGGGGEYDGYSIPENYSITQFGRYKATTSKDSIVFFGVWSEDSTTTFSVVLDSTGNMHLLKSTGDPSGLWLPRVASVVAAEQHKYLELVQLAEKFYNNKEHKNSAEYYDRAFKIHEGTSNDTYNAACSWALAGDKTKALKYLNQSVDFGWVHIDHLKNDADLSSLHQTKEWEDLIKKLKTKLNK